MPVIVLEQPSVAGSKKRSEKRQCPPPISIDTAHGFCVSGADSTEDRSPTENGRE